MTLARLEEEALNGANARRPQAAHAPSAAGSDADSGAEALAQPGRGPERGAEPEPGAHPEPGPGAAGLASAPLAVGRSGGALVRHGSAGSSRDPVDIESTHEQNQHLQRHPLG